MSAAETAFDRAPEDMDIAGLACTRGTGAAKLDRKAALAPSDALLNAIDASGRPTVMMRKVLASVD